MKKAYRKKRNDEEILKINMKDFYTPMLNMKAIRAKEVLKQIWKTCLGPENFG